MVCCGEKKEAGEARETFYLHDLTLRARAHDLGNHMRARGLGRHSAATSKRRRCNAPTMMALSGRQALLYSPL